MVQAAMVVLLVSICLKIALFSEGLPSEHGTEDFRVLGKRFFRHKRKSYTRFCGDGHIPTEMEERTFFAKRPLGGYGYNR